jgi:hypothetical protein
MTESLPPSFPPPPPDYEYAPGFVPPDRDTDHLRILSIFWYVIAGLECLGACFGLIYIVLGIVAFAGGMGRQAADGPPPAALGGLFSCVGVFFLALAGTLAFLSFKVARSLVARRSLTLCYVMAAILCLSIPLGTILGVFTLVVLSRPSVKASFASAAGG